MLAKKQLKNISKIKSRIINSLPFICRNKYDSFLTIKDHKNIPANREIIEEVRNAYENVESCERLCFDFPFSVSEYNFSKKDKIIFSFETNSLSMSDAMLFEQILQDIEIQNEYKIISGIKINVEIKSDNMKNVNVSHEKYGNYKLPELKSFWQTRQKI